jgi:hypothetical protein
MLRVLASLLIACAALTAFGCSSVTVQHDFDAGYDFRPLKTYGWLPASVPQGTSELKIKRFKSIFNNHMAAKGYTQDSDSPDFLVAMHLMAKDVIEVTNYGYRYGYRWGTTRVDVDTYTEGTAIVDFVDARSTEVFWRGVMTSVAEPELNAQQQEAKFTEAVEKLLLEFPPI